MRGEWSGSDLVTKARTRFMAATKWSRWNSFERGSCTRWRFMEVSLLEEAVIMRLHQHTAC